MTDVAVRPYAEDDKLWAYEHLFPHGGISRIASCQKLHDPLTLPGFVAHRGAERVGLAIYIPNGKEWELLSLSSVVENVGAGNALINAVKDAARSAGCRSVWLVTTNDNTHALRFYQRLGFVIREVRPGAVNRERETIKPEISLFGNDGIPIRDEIELVVEL